LAEEPAREEEWAEVRVAAKISKRSKTDNRKLLLKAIGLFMNKNK